MSDPARRNLFYGFGHRAQSIHEQPPLALVPEGTPLTDPVLRDQRQQEQQYQREREAQAAFTEALTAASQGNSRLALAWLFTLTSTTVEERAQLIATLVTRSVSACCQYYTPTYLRLAQLLGLVEPGDWTDEITVTEELITQQLQDSWQARIAVDDDECDELIEQQWCRCLGLRLAEAVVHEALLLADPLGKPLIPVERTLSQWEIIFTALISDESATDEMLRAITEAVAVEVVAGAESR